jgi:hypothetical protein
MRLCRISPLTAFASLSCFTLRPEPRKTGKTKVYFHEDRLGSTEYITDDFHCFLFGFRSKSWSGQWKPVFADLLTLVRKGGGLAKGRRPFRV